MGEEVLESQDPRSRGPKDQDISKSHSNTSLTLKKVHLVQILSTSGSWSLHTWYIYTLSEYEIEICFVKEEKNMT